MMIIDVTRSYARRVSALTELQKIKAANDADAGEPMTPEDPKRS
ncbi:hypothetical protein IQ22_03109 [Pseudomonas duriflava]|uniref:Uncharacterized protein n=1 Tax=Pseudomonas duriflava TaxID=459528 RepID=A0A562Q7L5_9PSED|nr:hypothetical protein [Pseudomonas duriflava]TWI52733.1 hypothetical protein IQ22_03109 [Pseudomonas duriflava]